MITKGRALDDAIATAFARDEQRNLEPKDRALARMIAATVLRRLGQLEAILGTFMDRMPSKDKGRLLPILLGGVAQLVFLAMPPHAVINIAVEQCRRDRREARFSGLVNAVLRRVSEQGEGIAAAQDQVRANVPDWLWSRWTKTYGEHLARAIGEGSLREAPLDITAKGDAATWAERLSGRLLPTGSIRVAAEGRVENLPGFAEGAWWVQDAAAALPARLFGRVEGKDIADLCAAPGGKTAQLAAQGARVTAVDIGPQRLDRLRSNLARLALEADVIEADATAWAPGRRFDGVLLDAPWAVSPRSRRGCSITRRNSSSRAAPSSTAPARSSLRKGHTKSRVSSVVRPIGPGRRSTRPKSVSTRRGLPPMATCAPCRRICALSHRSFRGSMGSMQRGSSGSFDHSRALPCDFLLTPFLPDPKSSTCSPLPTAPNALFWRCNRAIEAR